MNSNVDMATEHESQTDSSRRMYNARSSTYEDSWHPRFSKAVVAAARLQPGEHALDLACGTGLVTFGALAAVSGLADQIDITTGAAPLTTSTTASTIGHVIGVDISDGMLSIARAKQERLQSTLPQVADAIELLDGDVMHLEDVLTRSQQFNRNGPILFDAIFCASAFVLLDDPVAAIKDWVTRLRRPSGRIVLDVPHTRCFRAGVLASQVGRKLGLRVPFNRLWLEGEGDESLKKVLEEAELVVDSCELVPAQGVGTRWLEGTEEVARKEFREKVTGGAFKAFLEDDKVKATVEDEFARRWVQIGEEEGAVEDTDDLWLVVARLS